MKPFICLCWVIFATVWLSACGGRTAASSPRGGDTLDLRYAENLTLVDCGSYQMATLRNPWDTSQVLHTYLLVPRGDSLPVELPEGTVVRIPLERAVVFSSVHCALLEELGALDAIGGVCDLRYIMMPRIQERCRSGRIVDAGNGMNPDVEKIVSLRADALLLSPFENSGGYGRLGKLGVPLVECADYMETSPLGRAEWIRFYGRLFGRAAEADSVFAQVERRYRALASKAAGAGHRPKVLSDLKSGSAWYVPAGRSTTGRIYADAGGDYVFAGLEGSGSVPMSFETVYDKARDADVWLIKYNAPVDKTCDDLRRDYAPYAGFKAFRDRQIYGCNTAECPFYEETPFHPERLLADLVKMFHPGLSDSRDMRYFRKLAE